MECAFDVVAKEVIKHLFTYMHLIIFECIIQAPCVGFVRKSMSIDEICEATSLHSRDAMKCIYDLQSDLFLEMSTAAYEKRRIHVYGINYERLFNFLHAKLSDMYKTLNAFSSKDSLHCVICNQDFSFEQCIDAYTFETCCPNNELHALTERTTEDEDDKNVVATLFKKIDNLQDKKPIYVYHSHLNLSRVGED